MVDNDIQSNRVFGPFLQGRKAVAHGGLRPLGIPGLSAVDPAPGIQGVDPDRRAFSEGLVAKPERHTTDVVEKPGFAVFYNHFR